MTPVQKHMIRKARVGAFALQDVEAHAESLAIFRLISAFRAQHQRCKRLAAENLEMRKMLKRNGFYYD